MRSVLAGDLGGTKCRLALVAEDCTIQATQQFATVRERGPFLERFDAAIAACLAQCPTHWQRPTAAGFGTAGVIPSHGQWIHRAPNLPLDEFPLVEHVQQRFALRSVLLNDGRASAWGESVRGHACGADPLLCLFFGTGIGIGLMVGGRPFLGGNNAAGEIGHTIYQPGGRRCPCGALGHFEAYCGGRAILEQAQQQLGNPPSEFGAQWSAGSVAAVAQRKDATGDRAREILEEAATAAVTLVANACTLLNPQAVVLGGGVLSGWPQLRERICQEVPRRTSPLIHESLRFLPSLGESDAILWGSAAAAGLALHAQDRGC